jgi:glycine betaine transporter
MVVLVGVIATYSALTGLNKAIKFLADLDFTFSIILMLFIAFFLNFNDFIYHTAFAYNYVIHFFEMSLSIGNYKPPKVLQKIGRYFTGLLVSMGTFTGIFIARISKGRTIKEFFNNYNCYSNISYCYLVFSLCESAFTLLPMEIRPNLIMFSLHYLFF